MSAAVPRITVRIRNRNNMSGVSEQLIVYQIAQAMNDDPVHLLNARRGCTRHANIDILSREYGGYLASLAAVQRHAGDVALVRRLHRANHVARITRGGNPEQHVAGLAERTQ